MKRNFIIRGQIRGQKMAAIYYHNKEWEARNNQMGRRGENIHKRRDGRWEARVVIGPPVNGRTRYKSLFAHSYAEARAKKLAFLASYKVPPSSAAPVLNTPPSPAAPVLNPLASPTAPTRNVPPSPATAEHSEFSFLDSVLPLSISPESFDEMAQKPQVTFREIAEQWLSSKKLAWKESSFAFYSVMVEKHLLPTFGEADIKKSGFRHDCGFPD
ncbi:MAG: hypothetical protein LUI39_14095 [Lachnospiraceae bacterium]|nr:hypothetical protein [Lachnospiraceae bacterium]